MDVSSPLRCPVCAHPLHWGSKSCSCDKGHSFDRAKEGYVNLLLSHCRRTKNPGDNAAMVQARRHFLQSGAYAPLAERVAQGIASHSTNAPINLLDVGCGEGYFLHPLLDHSHIQAYGIDISKEAVRYAARNEKRVRWIVTNAMRKLPFADHTIHQLVSILAPRNIHEFSRVIAPNGHLLIVVPGSQHLIELRKQLMNVGSSNQNKVEDALTPCAPHFNLKKQSSLTYSVVLNTEELSHLVQMTPLFWHSTQESKTTLNKIDHLEITIDFSLLWLNTKKRD